MPRGPDLLVVGEVVIDLISAAPVAGLEEAAAFQRLLGGAAANVARNLAALGLRPALLACVGRDPLGRWAAARLAREGVDVDRLQWADRAPTTLILVTRGTGTPDFLAYRGADRCLALEGLPPGPPPRWVHATGFALAAAPLRPGLLALLEAARARGLPISFDPNVHPRLWEGPEPMAEGVARAVALADVVKPSRDDLARLFGAGVPVEEGIARLRAWGARHVVVTLGAKGALWVDPRGRARPFPAPAVEAVDVTGAGDAFWAGLIAARLDGMGMEAAVRAGLRAAAWKLARVGPLRGPLDRRRLYEGGEGGCGSPS